MIEFIPNNLGAYLGRQTSIKELCCKNNSVRAQKSRYDTWCEKLHVKIYPNPTPDIKFSLTCYKKNKAIAVATWKAKIKEAKGKQSIRPN